jgi:YegS/Rv2252/BmrU family lipid kinase
MLDQSNCSLEVIADLPLQITVIYNPISGRRNHRKLRRFVETAMLRGLTVIVRTTRHAGEAEAMAVEAAADGWTEVVVVAGGDGTINEVINGLAGAALPPLLGLLPLGTANVLAAEIAVSDSATTLVDSIVRVARMDGASTRICVARANGRRFALMAGVGFDAHLVAAVDRRMKRLTGKAAYVEAFARTTIGFGNHRYRVLIDGVTYEAASAVIANGHFYGGRFTCTPEARIDEPDLHVCLFLRGSRWSTLGYGISLLRGRLHRSADVRIVRGRDIQVEGWNGEPVQCDGDVTTMLPLHVQATDERLRLIAPAAAR